MAEQAELGQMMFGAPTGEYPCPRWVDALVAAILSEIRRVYWNVNQEAWESEYTDPKIPGVEVHGYSWCMHDDCFDAEPRGPSSCADCERPNLAHEGIEVRWYKHPGRGTSLNVEARPELMIAWFDSCIETICMADSSDGEYQRAKQVERLTAAREKLAAVRSPDPQPKPESPT